VLKYVGGAATGKAFDHVGSVVAGTIVIGIECLRKWRSGEEKASRSISQEHPLGGDRTTKEDVVVQGQEVFGDAVDVMERKGDRMRVVSG
jgi:trehalose utilization protein